MIGEYYQNIISDYRFLNGNEQISNTQINFFYLRESWVIEIWG